MVIRSDAVSAHHLQVLRGLLSRDYLTRADWSWALKDLAQMAKEALHASEALVALADEGGRWTAVTSDGGRLTGEEISRRGSLAVLEEIRKHGEPLLTSGLVALGVDSESLRLHDVGSVLAVPVRFWDVHRESPERTLGGCLYTHRTRHEDPFSEADVDLMVDITRIVEPTLNLLRYLTNVETDLMASRLALEELRSAEAGTPHRLGDYVTHDADFARNVIATLKRVSSAQRVGLLILGPTGSGKSHLAQAYHYESPRRNGPFVILDCSQVTSAETLTAELFGYGPNSGFSNAPPKGRAGKAQLAHGGTIFIDEIGSMPLDLQQKLLRLIQEGTFSPLGASDEHAVDIQVIAASNEDLRRLVKTKRFREDLFWRIGEVTIELPPLDKRTADIPHLARAFLEKAKARYGRSDIQGLSPTALDALSRHAWSRAGNVRGLEHTVNRSVLLAPAGTRLLDAEAVELDVAFDETSSGRIPPIILPVGRSVRRLIPPAQRDRLRVLLARKIASGGGTLSAMAVDREVATAFGYERGSMPESTLNLWIRELDLEDLLAQERQKKRETSTDLDSIREAIRRHGSGTAAARALGMTRDALVWQLRKQGLTIEDVLANATESGE